MTLQRFALDNRLKITTDELYDPIIQGKVGQIFVDAGEVCAQWLDAPRMLPSRLKQIGGKLWIGDLSPNAKGKMVQDVKIDYIPASGYRLAITMAKARAKRILTPKQTVANQAQLAAARAVKKAPRKSSTALIPARPAAPGSIRKRKVTSSITQNVLARGRSI